MSNELILSLGWTLLHSLWQIGLLGLFTLGLERLLRSYSAQLRHQLLLLMLGVTVLICAITLFQEWQHFTQIRYLLMNTMEGAGQTNPNILQLNPSYLLSPAPLPLLWRCKMWVEQQLFWLVAFWLLGMVYSSVRFGWNCWFLQRLRKQSAVLQEPQLLALIEKIQGALGLQKRVRFYIHPTLGSPLTFGYFRPVILLPIALLCQTSPDLLEALLRHELIHIRRADFLVNLLLSVAQILFFYHPMVWIITRRIQELREEACDAAVLDSGCNKLIYAEALIHLQKLLHQNIPLAMQAQNHPSHFAERVRQVLLKTDPRPTNAKYSRALGGVMLLALFLCLTALSSFKPAAKTKEIDKMFHTVVPVEKTPQIKYPVSLKEQPQVQNSPGTTLASKQKVFTPTTPASVKDSFPFNHQDKILRVAVEGMNVLQIGVDNPISIAVSGVPAEQVKASSQDLRLTAIGAGKYIAHASRPGRAVIMVEAPNYREEVIFKVRLIDDPVAVLEKLDMMGGALSVSNMKKLKALDTKILGFDANVKCNIIGFTLFYMPKKGNPVQIPNSGAGFSDKLLQILQTLAPEDQLVFDRIQVQCPGDDKYRKINNIALTIVADPEKKE